MKKMAYSTPEGDFKPMYAALQELDLTENEQRLYILSLTQGPMSITALAEHLGLPRPNLYKIIDGLITKGLADKESRLRYTKRFSVEAPSKISELLRLKREQQAVIDHSFIEKLPSYIAEFRQGEGPMKLKVFVGRKDFERLYGQMYDEAESSMRFCGSLRNFDRAFGQGFISQNVQKRLKKNIKGIALILPSDRGYYSDERNREDQREVRYLQDVSDFATSFHVFANKVVFWQPEVPMALLIEDEFLVIMMRNLFESMWRRARVE